VSLSEEYRLLYMLSKVNKGMGGAAQRMLDYQAEHGHLPADELRTLGFLLTDLASELVTYAADVEKATTRELEP
jgi:hypothetical protein